MNINSGLWRLRKPRRCSSLLYLLSILDMCKHANSTGVFLSQTTPKQRRHDVIIIARLTYSFSFSLKKNHMIAHWWQRPTTRRHRGSMTKKSRFLRNVYVSLYRRQGENSRLCTYNMSFTPDVSSFLLPQFFHFLSDYFIFIFAALVKRQISQFNCMAGSQASLMARPRCISMNWTRDYSFWLGCKIGPIIGCYILWDTKHKPEVVKFQILEELTVFQRAKAPDFSWPSYLWKQFYVPKLLYISGPS